MELLNNRYAFYMLGRGSAPPQAPRLSVNAFCIVTNSAHETPVYPLHFPIATEAVVSISTVDKSFQHYYILYRQVKAYTMSYPLCVSWPPYNSLYTDISRGSVAREEQEEILFCVTHKHNKHRVKVW